MAAAKQRGRGRGTVLIAKGRTLELPHLKAHTADVRAADYLGSDEYCGTLRRMEGVGVAPIW